MLQPRTLKSLNMISSPVAPQDTPNIKGPSTQIAKYIYVILSNLLIKHSWSNGRIIAFQAIGPGSTPGGCRSPSQQLHCDIFSFCFFKLLISVHSGCFVFARSITL
ncbi:hypothetical protein IQ06DRAFT_4121 [Phaeosphaeriaceae sp. SRC1lsM3a]|nr:hypothetical protein IQ06DRAFT_4121 [Stagonospora sp. SRC1lsM3a]